MRYVFRELGNPPPRSTCCDIPHWYLVSHRHICAIPHLARYLRVGFGRMDFFADFVFWAAGPPDFSADFDAGFFLLISVGKSAQKNPPGGPPANPPKVIQQKSTTYFCRGARPRYRAIIVRYPIKTSTGAPTSFAILSLQASRDVKSRSARPLKGEGRNSEIPKSVGQGSEKPLALVQTWVAPVQTGCGWCKRLCGDLCFVVSRSGGAKCPTESFMLGWSVASKSRRLGRSAVLKTLE